MTVSYAENLLRLLFHWKGSVWKAIWRDVLVWLALYYSLRFALEKGFVEKSSKEVILKITKVFQSATSEMPIGKLATAETVGAIRGPLLGFMLGFYVTQVLTRWWAQVQSLPWPDEAMSLVNAYLSRGDTPENLLLRRHSIARYLILTQIIALSGVSSRVRKRFPTVEHLVTAGLMTTEEHQMMMNCPCPNLRWQLPLQWAQNLIIPLVGVGPNLISPTSATSIYRELNTYRAALRSVFMHDWINIPLVITQATGVGLYGYFLLSIFGRQTLADNNFETWIPFGPIIKFCGYVGWFRVAQDLLRPFGKPISCPANCFFGY